MCATPWHILRRYLIYYYHLTDWVGVAMTYLLTLNECSLIEISLALVFVIKLFVIEACNPIQYGWQNIVSNLYFSLVPRMAPQLTMTLRNWKAYQLVTVTYDVNHNALHCRCWTFHFGGLNTFWISIRVSSASMPKDERIEFEMWDQPRSGVFPKRQFGLTKTEFVHFSPSGLITSSGLTDIIGNAKITKKILPCMQKCACFAPNDLV